MTGMLVADYADRFPEAIAELSGWYRSGRLIAQETVVQGGVEDFPQTLLMLFQGTNTGKLVLELAAGR
jgi:NADPH-dependent curcumin reductase CurA